MTDNEIGRLHIFEIFWKKNIDQYVKNIQYISIQLLMLICTWQMTFNKVQQTSFDRHGYDIMTVLVHYSSQSYSTVLRDINGIRLR